MGLAVWVAVVMWNATLECIGGCAFGRTLDACDHTVVQ